MRGLPAQLEALLAGPRTRVLDRLFPPSYSDAGEEEAHRELLGRALLDERRAMLVAVRGALAGARQDGRGLRLTLDGVAMDLWLRFLNDVRLVLATDLGIESNQHPGRDEIPPSHPDAPRLALLDYLGGLEALMVDALAREM